MFYQISLSPQVKRCAIITCKHGIHRLPHELLNNLRLKILGKILSADLHITVRTSHAESSQLEPIACTAHSPSHTT